MTRETLLPPNRTELEEAFDLTGARVDELPVDLPKLVRPYEIPSAHLPWLAWGLSVDLWEKEWPEEKHRNLVANALPMHARKGTQTSIAEHIKIVGGTARRFTTPPSKTFMSPAFTEPEREAYLARFAQVRVYPFVARGASINTRFLSAADGSPTAFCGRVTGQSGMSQWYRSAKLWDRGEETSLTIRTVTPESVGSFEAFEYDEIVLGQKATAAIHLDAPPKARSFLIDDMGVRQRMIRVPRSADYSYRLGRETYTTAYPNADLIDVRPQSVAEQHPGQPTALYATGGQFLAGKHLPPTIAWQHLFERWHVHDPERVPDIRVRSTHLGYARLGMPAYHAEVQTRIVGKRQPRTAGDFVNGYLVAGDRKPIGDVREAVRVSKSLRDKVLIDTKTYRFPVAGDRYKVGAVTLGRYIEV